MRIKATIHRPDGVTLSFTINMNDEIGRGVFALNAHKAKQCGFVVTTKQV
jgi:hypothetical protein